MTKQTTPDTGADFVWPKGATYWGEPLPYAAEQDGARYVVYDGWWTDKRVQALSAWSAEAYRALLQVFGDDRALAIGATAKVWGERASRLRREGGAKVNFRALFEGWTPTPEEATRKADLLAEAERRRDQARSVLLAVAAANPGGIEELDGEPATWTSIQMAMAALRLPKLLLVLAAEGALQVPNNLVPEKALQ